MYTATDLVYLVIRPAHSIIKSTAYFSDVVGLGLISLM